MRCCTASATASPSTTIWATGCCRSLSRRVARSRAFDRDACSTASTLFDLVQPPPRRRAVRSTVSERDS